MSAEQQPTPGVANPDRKTLDNRAKTTELKRCLRVLMAVAVLSVTLTAARAETQIPEATKALHTKLIATAKPPVREWILQEAKKVSQQPANAEATVKTDIKTRFAGQNLAGADIEAMTFLVMMEVAQDAQNDLKSAMAEMKSANEKKAAQRQAVANLKKEEAGLKATARQEYTRPANTNLQVRPKLVKLQSVDRAVDNTKDKQDSMSEMSEAESLRLQMAMDRRAKAIETLSNRMKKFSETSSNIVSNLK